MFFMFFIFFDEEATEENKQRFIDRLVKEVPEALEWAQTKIMEINDARYLTLIINHYENKGYKKLEEYIEFLNNHRRFTEKDREKFWDKYYKRRGIRR